jgi:hypothetical protein
MYVHRSHQVGIMTTNTAVRRRRYYAARRRTAGVRARIAQSCAAMAQQDAGTERDQDS